MVIIHIVQALSSAIVITGAVFWLYNVTKPIEFRKDVAEPFMKLVIFLMAYWPLTLIFLTAFILIMWSTK